MYRLKKKAKSPASVTKRITAETPPTIGAVSVAPSLFASDSKQRTKQNKTKKKKKKKNQQQTNRN